MRIKSILFVLFSMLIFESCQEEVIPKPKAKLRLEYPTTDYSVIEILEEPDQYFEKTGWQCHDLGLSYHEGISFHYL